MINNGTIYLDYNATAPLQPEVKAAMTAVMGMPHNPSSIHSFGREARKLVENARLQLATVLECETKQIMFAGSATEINNHILRGVESMRILVLETEHPSVLKAVPDAVMLPVDADGVVDLQKAEAVLAEVPRGALVSVMLANNETGVIQPVKQLCDIAHNYGALVHCDAVQAWGRIPVVFTQLGADFMTISSHKVGGPVGAAALVTGPCIPVKPLLKGGGQEGNQRAGTENVVAIVGLGAMAQQIGESLAHMESLREWRDQLESAFKAIAPDMRVMGAGAKRLPNTLNITMPNVSSEIQLMNFDLAGIALSAGSACSSGKVSVSHVLTAMGVDKNTATTAMRVSMGWASTERDLETFAKEWARIYERCGASRVSNAA